MKRKLVLALGMGMVVAAAGIGATVWLLWGREWVIRIPEAQIQEALDRRFPVLRRHLLIFTIRYQNPKVALAEGSDRLRASVDAETLFAVNERPFTGAAVVSGDLEYHPATGEFRLREAKVERFAVGGLPEKYTTLVAQVGTGLLQDHLDRSPVYRLKPTDVKQAAARLALKRVVVRNGHLEVTLGLGR
jgi:hypothetical protein